MSELLFECLCEEIPTLMQSIARKQLQRMFSEQLCKHSMRYTDLSVFTTPRRLVVMINDLARAIQGPQENASTELSSNALDEVLCDIIQNVLQCFSWPKTMRWGDTKVKWVRPITSLLCILDNEILPICFAKKRGQNKTYGHRFIVCNKRLTVDSIGDYQTKLRENYVIIDHAERRTMLLQQIDKIAQEHKLSVALNEKLLEKTIASVEYPSPILGKIPDEFLSLPDDIITTTVQQKQGYFNTYSKDTRSLAPYFIAISNGINNQKVVQGHETVLKARLADTRFLFERDKKQSITHYVQALEQIVLHEKLGTLADKSKRLASLATYLALWIPNTPIVMVEKAALLAKADLATAVVNEFPQLHGIMGRYYALLAGEREEIAQALFEYQHHPSSPLAITIALADRIDEIIGLLLAKVTFTAKKDPFGIRRLVLSVIKILLQNKLHIPLTLIFDKALSLYAIDTHKLFTAVKDKNNIIRDTLNYFYERIRVILYNKNIHSSVIEAVLVKHNDVLRIAEEAELLNTFLHTEQGKSFIQIYKRVFNILNKEEKKYSHKYSVNYSKKLLLEKAEQDLCEQLEEVTDKLSIALKQHNFSEGLALLATLLFQINKFMNTVTINCEARDIKKQPFVHYRTYCTSIRPSSCFCKDIVIHCMFFVEKIWIIVLYIYSTK